MTTYKEIFGKYVKNYSSDPSFDAEGQVWYNTTSGTFKSVVASAAWSSGSPGIQARRLTGGTGTQTAALAMGGVGPNPTVFNNTEEYNGSGWSTGANYPTLVFSAAASGTQTAALIFGGSVPSPAYTTAANTYNGSTYASAGSLNTGRASSSNNIGTQTASLAAGGGEPLSNASEEYNGTSWTSGNSINTARQGIGAGGIQTAAFIAGGEGPGSVQTAASEEYDGTSWVTGNSLNTARYFLSGTGPQTAGIVFTGGEPANSNKTETYNGTSWTTAPTLSTARSGGMGAGTSNSSALAAFGSTGPTALLSITEEFNVSSSIITAAAWASGGNLSTPRSRHTGFGSQTAAVAAANNPSPRVITEEYNGSAWGSGGNMNTGRQELAGLGTLTAGLAFGGEIGPNTQATEEYDGSTWTNGGNLTSPAGIQAGPSAAGTQTAALQGGGATTTPAPVGVINWSGEYDGSAWTTGNNINTSRSAGLGGTQTAGVLAGGGAFPAPIPGFVTENYDGTTWTNSNSQLSPGNAFNIAGPVTNSVWIGIGPNPTTSVHFYDGTTFTTGASYATARSASAGAGDTATAGLIFGGNPGAQIASTEEYNPETTAANVKTITTS
jgi:hypothetical protein